MDVAILKLSVADLQSVYPRLAIGSLDAAIKEKSPKMLCNMIIPCLTEMVHNIVHNVIMDKTVGAFVLKETT